MQFVGFFTRLIVQLLGKDTFPEKSSTVFRWYSKILGRYWIIFGVTEVKLLFPAIFATFRRSLMTSTRGKRADSKRRPLNVHTVNQVLETQPNFCLPFLIHLEQKRLPLSNRSIRPKLLFQAQDTRPGADFVHRHMSTSIYDYEIYVHYKVSNRTGNLLSRRFS